MEYFYRFIGSQLNKPVDVRLDTIITSHKSKDEKLEEFSQLLQFAPDNFIDKVIDKLQEYKKLDDGVY